MALISIIIPTFNEEKNIIVIAETLINIMASTKHELELIFINDGSADNSEEILNDLSSSFANVYFINFSRNFGQQNALRAGYDHSQGEAVICMDADFQNPPEIILELIENWENGFDVVVCKRKNGKQNASLFKELTSRAFYKLLSLLSDNPVDQNTPDFRLIDRKLVNIIKGLPENDIFLRGIVSWLGFNKAVVEYTHANRINGKTQYSVAKMLKLAESGITSFSIRPLHMAIYLGILFSCLSLLYVPYVFFRYFNGHTISGWSSLIVTIVFLGGLQLFILGVLGIYLGKIFLQTKQRPNYIIKNSNVEMKKEFA